MGVPSLSCFCCGTHRCWLLSIVVLGITWNILECSIYILDLVCPPWYEENVAPCTAESNAYHAHMDRWIGVVNVLQTLLVMMVLCCPICAEQKNKPSLLAWFRVSLFYYLALFLTFKFVSMIAASTFLVLRSLGVINTTLVIVFLIMLTNTRYEELTAAEVQIIRQV